jgi:hypothetical protein
VADSTPYSLRIGAPRGILAAMIRYPDEPTTPQQWHVIAWLAILLLAGFGAVAFYYAGTLPPDKAKAAAALREMSYWAWAIAALVYVAKRLAPRLID